MADITYCNYKGCPITKCERHPSKISTACRRGIGYVSVSNYAEDCEKLKNKLR